MAATTRFQLGMSGSPSGSSINSWAALRRLRENGHGLFLGVPVEFQAVQHRIGVIPVHHVFGHAHVTDFQVRKCPSVNTTLPPPRSGTVTWPRRRPCGANPWKHRPAIAPDACARNCRPGPPGRCGRAHNCDRPRRARRPRVPNHPVCDSPAPARFPWRTLQPADSGSYPGTHERSGRAPCLDRPHQRRQE